jgi:hypothetical protein
MRELTRNQKRMLSTLLAKLRLLQSKKIFNSNFHSSKSTKELFDWDANTLERLRADHSEPKSFNRKISFMTESKIFDDSPIKQGKQGSANSQFNGTGDIFTWRDAPSRESKTNGKRRSLNNQVREVEINLYKNKSNKLFKSSEDNCLYSK